MTSPLRIAAAWLALVPGALAGTLYVDVNLATGAGDGSSWADAFRGVDAIQSALGVATVGDELWVAAGLYKPTATNARGSSFQLQNGIAIYGGFAGGETSLAERDPGANVCVLSGDLNGDDPSGLYGDNVYHVVLGGTVGASAVLDGFTVTGGNANGGGSNQDRGAGILCIAGSSPTLRSCKFVDNRCTFGGGAGYINSSSPTFLECTFDNNQGGAYGGAFDMASGVGATFDRCVFTNNRAARAGAIEIFGSSPVKVYNSLFTLNTSTGSGGGGAMFISGSSPLVRNCTVVANTATANATGGILSSGSSPSIVNCIVDANVGAGGSTGATAQITPGVSVTYSLVPAGYNGTGNVTTAPTYDNSGPLPYRLAPGSAGIDAGNNAGVPLGVVLDLAGGARFVDDPGVPDTGAGTAPIVDMGAFETEPDCNANGVPDPLDILNGTSLDTNGNGVPDECECIGGADPLTYCTTKINSQFCVPAIGFSGYASASSGAPFLITATSVLNQKSGLLFYGYQSQAVPFQGGWLCVRAPIRRTPIANSGGSPTGLDCTGTFSFDFNAHIASGVDPLIQAPGQQVNAQFWSRDPQDPFTTNTTDAVQFNVCQ